MSLAWDEGVLWRRPAMAVLGWPMAPPARDGPTEMALERERERIQFPFPFPFPFHPFRNPFLPVPITVLGHFWALHGTERKLTRSSYRYYRSCDRSHPVPIPVPSRSRGRSCPFLYRSTRSRVGVGTDLGYFGPFLPRHATSVHLGGPNQAL